MTGASVLNPVGQRGAAGPTGPTGPATATGFTASTAAAGNDQRMNGVNPEVNGFQFWSDDILRYSTGQALATGSLKLIKVYAPGAATLNNLYVVSTATASGLTYAAMGIYSSAGVLLASSADVHSTWNGAATGLQTVALSSAYAWPGGAGAWFYIAVLVVGTTGPSLLYTNSSYTNMNVAAGTFRSATFASQTSLPSTLTLSGSTVSTYIDWAAAA